MMWCDAMNGTQESEIPEGDAKLLEIFYQKPSGDIAAIYKIAQKSGAWPKICNGIGVYEVNQETVPQLLKTGILVRTGTDDSGKPIFRPIEHPAVKGVSDERGLFVIDGRTFRRVLEGFEKTYSALESDPKRDLRFENAIADPRIYGQIVNLANALKGEMRVVVGYLSDLYTAVKWPQDELKTADTYDVFSEKFGEDVASVLFSKYLWPDRLISCEHAQQRYDAIDNDADARKLWLGNRLAGIRSHTLQPQVIQKAITAIEGGEKNAVMDALYPIAALDVYVLAGADMSGNPCLARHIEKIGKSKNCRAYLSYVEKKIGAISQNFSELANPDPEKFRVEICGAV